MMAMSNNETTRHVSDRLCVEAKKFMAPISLEFHGAAANSNHKVVDFLNDDCLVYASHAIINLASRHTFQDEPVWNVNDTVRTSAVITTLSVVDDNTILVGYENGAVSSWVRNGGEWNEEPITDALKESITVADAIRIDEKLISAVGTFQGFYVYPMGNQNLPTTAISALRWQTILDRTWLFVGTALPRRNQIHVYALEEGLLNHLGGLSGHEDWITCFDFSAPLLASGSNDARIRLWKISHDASKDVYDDESRLEVVRGNQTTNISLEALLLGHEGKVTGVAWHPNAKQTYDHDHVLISSSMDRSILFWAPAIDDVWTPLTRVGSAGGILGGSVGSSLLGYCSVLIRGNQLVGHAYGGSLHVWTAHTNKAIEGTEIRWSATPCVTGHFDGVTDICWEACNGDYLLSVSNDQTCRLWHEITTAASDTIWIELTRPQVHGYNLSAVTSLSTIRHKHLMITGADEKDLRIFDAPRMTERILKAATGEKENDPNQDATIERVDRAYIPSLGLSNKASAADKLEEAEGAEDRIESSSFENIRLPLERDLGAVSLWPEANKLFGHNTELYCLASWSSEERVLVASSCKARTVEDAAIRLWDIQEQSCLQVLSGGHKSTVATMSFSASGEYLASSGKDRRLCLWKKASDGLFNLAWAKDSAHKRIIWSVDWCGGILASGSRDGCVRIWKLQDEELVEMYELSPVTKVNLKPVSVAALSFAPPLSDSKTVLALGLENGLIELFSISLLPDIDEPKCIWQLSSHQCHNCTISKLSWRPREPLDGVYQLASGSLDHGCRIFGIKLSDLNY